MLCFVHFDYSTPLVQPTLSVAVQHYERPFPSTGIVEDELMQLPEHLAAPTIAAQRDITAGASLGC